MKSIDSDIQMDSFQTKVSKSCSSVFFPSLSVSQSFTETKEKRVEKKV